MPLFCPRYRIDYLITKKSFEFRVPQKSIYADLCTLLGGITLKHLWRIRKNQIGENGILSAEDLIKLKDYFNCTLDDLIVQYDQPAYLPTPDTTSSCEEVVVGPKPVQS